MVLNCGHGRTGLNRGRTRKGQWKWTGRAKIYSAESVHSVVDCPVMSIFQSVHVQSVHVHKLEVPSGWPARTKYLRPGMETRLLVYDERRMQRMTIHTISSWNVIWNWNSIWNLWISKNRRNMHFVRSVHFWVLMSLRISFRLRRPQMTWFCPRSVSRIKNAVCQID